LFLLINTPTLDNCDIGKPSQNVLQSSQYSLNITAGVVDHPPASREPKVKARQALRSANKIELALPAPSGVDGTGESK